MSVTAPAGFEAAGVAAGLKSTGKPDVAVVVKPWTAQGRRRRLHEQPGQGQPDHLSQQAVADRVVEAVVLNSGGANCFTGSFGFQTTHQTAEKGGRAPRRERRRRADLLDRSLRHRG